MKAVPLCNSPLSTLLNGFVSEHQSLGVSARLPSQAESPCQCVVFSMPSVGWRWRSQQSARPLAQTGLAVVLVPRLERMKVMILSPLLRAP